MRRIYCMPAWPGPDVSARVFLAGSSRLQARAFIARFVRGTNLLLILGRRHQRLVERQPCLQNPDTYPQCVKASAE